MTQATLEQRILRFIQSQSLLSGQTKLLVAVSGGPDSVCLLHILYQLRQQLDISLHAAHLDHQLRGTESENDARYVANLTKQLGIPATVESRDVKAYQAQHRQSPEEAAREVRYNFLAEVTVTTGAQAVTVGHTIDDNVETILMHLIRGSGIRGLRGLQPISRWQYTGKDLIIIRPLLEISREETAAYCQQHRLMPRIDTSNLSLSPLRNRIRQQLVPLLQSYNPQVTEALLRTAHLVTDELAFLDKEIDRAWPEIVTEQDDTIILDKHTLCQLDPALQRHLLRACLERLLDNLKDIEAIHTEEIINALNKPAGRKISLPEGLYFAIEYDRYLLGRDPSVLSPFPTLESEATLKIPGATKLAGWEITASIAGKEEFTEKGDELNAYLDLEKAGNKLTVRHRQRGDRFQPLGMSQSKKLSDFMIDTKIPRSWRQNIPVVSSPGHIVWVVGGQIDERVKVSKDTKQVLRLEFKRC